MLQLPSTQAGATAAGRSRARSAKKRVTWRGSAGQMNAGRASSAMRRAILQWDCKRKEGQTSGTSRGPEKQGFFSFRRFERASEEGALELLVDSGCNGIMLKDRALFKEIDEAFKTNVSMRTGIEHEWKVVAQHDVGCWTARAGCVSSS